MKTKVVQILIRRGITSEVVDVVLAHEVPILKVIRGAGNITVVEENCKQYNLKPGDAVARNELLRLKTKYRGFVKDGEHPVDIAFPDGSRDLELYYEDPSVFDNVGEDIETDDDGNPLSSAPEYTPPGKAEVPAPEPTFDPASVIDPEEDVVEEDPGIDLTDRPAVIEALTALEVPFAKTTPTVHLATLLTNSLEQGAGADATE